MVAPRYKDNDRVYYELTREPTFTFSDYLKPEFKASFLSLYNAVRTQAHDRQVLLFSFNTIAADIVNAVDSYQDQIDWMHTAVAYHMYHSTTSAAVRALLSKYPVICKIFIYSLNIQTINCFCKSLPEHCLDIATVCTVAVLILY